MPARSIFFSVALIFLLLIECSPCSAQAADSTDASATTLQASPQTADPDSTSLLKKLEDHPVLIGLMGTILGALLTLAGLYLQRQTKKKTKELAKAKKKGEIEVEKEIEIDVADDIERRYLLGVKAEHESINLYGFQSTANLKVRTLELFVSLRLSEYWHGGSRREMSEMTLEPEMENHRQLSPEEVLQRAFRKQRLLLIIGDPGAGKTTLMKYFTICSLDEAGRRKLGLSKPLIPIFVPLRKVDPAKPFCESLSAWATQKNRPVTPKLFDEWLEKRGALIMLDGLDEISEAQSRKQVCEWIDNACDYYGNSRFVVTSRFSGYRVAEGIELQTDHLRADVLDLDATQQETFLKKWFTAAYKDEIETAELSAKEKLIEIETQAQEVADEVKKYLALDENAGLCQMAGTPVLLQIMAILWKEYGSLASGRAALYERCTDYLLDRRDRVRSIPVLLPAEQAKIILRPVCLWMQEELKSDEAPRKKLEEKIKPVLEEVKPGVLPADFIKNLHDRAGILQKLGDDAFVFRHRSFREFLAAGQLADEIRANPERAAVLVENFNEGWWRETILFATCLPKPVIFGNFFEKFLPHEFNETGFPILLEQIIKEAQQKPTAAFENFLLDQRHHWQKRHNALQCLRLIASEPAKALVQKVWEEEKRGAKGEGRRAESEELRARGEERGAKSEGRRARGEERMAKSEGGRAESEERKAKSEKNEVRVLQKAEEILIEWKLRKPAVASVAVSGMAKSWRNPIELEAEYILIPGAKEKIVFESTDKLAPDYPVYFAKYPVTNKQYRRFIDYLSLDSSEGLDKILPYGKFVESLLAKAKTIEGFSKYLGDSPAETHWPKLFASREDNNKRFNGDDQPVVAVTWYAAVAYCQWLSELQKANGKKKKESLVFRLPTEEEWEWAASGGKREYPWGNEELDETRANYGNKVGQTTPVGTCPAGATPDGLLDMAGNAWEWMENLYGAKDFPEARALRGGSWLYTIEFLRCAARYYFHPVNLWNDYGFRVVCGQSFF